MKKNKQRNNLNKYSLLLLIFLILICYFIHTSTANNDKNNDKNNNKKLIEKIDEFNSQQEIQMNNFYQINQQNNTEEFPKAKRTKEGKASIFLHSFISIRLDQQIFRYFLNYYLKKHSISPQQFLLVFHVDNSLSLLEQENDFANFFLFYQPILQQYQITNYLLWYSSFSVVNVKKFENSMLKSFLPPSDWLIRVDSDEFISLPPIINQFYEKINRDIPNLVDFITLLDEFGFTYLKGHFVDRFAKDCSLSPLLPFDISIDNFNNYNNNNNNYNNNNNNDQEIDCVDDHLSVNQNKNFNNNNINNNLNNNIKEKEIFEQYPCKTNFTRDVSKAHNQKASILRSLFRTSNGNHCLLNEKNCYFGTVNFNSLPLFGKFQNENFFHTLNRENIEEFLAFLSEKFKVENYQEIILNLNINKEIINYKNGRKLISYLNDFQLEVNHFKWNAFLKNKLKKRINDIKTQKHGWFNESEIILDYFDEEGKLSFPIDGCPC